MVLGSSLEKSTFSDVFETFFQQRFQNNMIHDATIKIFL